MGASRTGRLDGSPFNFSLGRDARVHPLLLELGEDLSRGKAPPCFPVGASHLPADLRRRVRAGGLVLVSIFCERETCGYTIEPDRGFENACGCDAHPILHRTI